MKRKGFTLIELLVVIAIIGILATIGLVALNGAREKARDASRKSDISQIKTALVLYSDDSGSAYPATPGTSCQTGINCTGTLNSIFDTAPATNPVLPEYISKSPGDPVGSATLNYSYSTCLINGITNGGYILYARLEGGAKGYFWVNGAGVSGDNTATLGSCG